VHFNSLFQLNPIIFEEIPNFFKNKIVDIYMKIRDIMIVIINWGFPILRSSPKHKHPFGL
jgi:hypothetical protein